MVTKEIFFASQRRPKTVLMWTSDGDRRNNPIASGQLQIVSHFSLKRSWVWTNVYLPHPLLLPGN